jgi:predicted enzyme related to lactoylglutathione lyase
MITMPIVYVSDMDRGIEFYGKLGFPLRQQGRSASWAELEAGGAILALHLAPEGWTKETGRVELAFVATEQLDELAARLQEDGVPIARAITDEAFGRSLQVRDPDGLIIQINEHDKELYT